MSDLFGSLTVPVGTDSPLGDPCLEYLLPFLQAHINANALAAWQTVSAAAGAWPNPVKKTHFYDPAELPFSENELPALYAWRERGKHEQIGEDYVEDTSTVHLMYVLPPVAQESQAKRTTFFNAIVKLVAMAIFNGRTPTYVVAGDTDPDAATKGSFIWPFAGSALLWLDTYQTRRFVVRTTAGMRSYDAIHISLEQHELMVLDNTQHGTSAMGGVQITITEGGEQVDEGQAS